MVCSMSVNNDKIVDSSVFQSISQNETIKNTTKSKLQTDIAKCIGTNFFTKFFNNIFFHNRVVELKILNDRLNSEEIPEASWLSTHIPEKTKNLFTTYLNLFNEVETAKVLTQEDFQKIWESKQDTPIGEGGFGVVYQSECGKYALKVPKDGTSLEEDRIKNETLKNNAKAFDSEQFYYEFNKCFITKYMGTFKTKDNVEVAVFEKIEGINFSSEKGNGETLAQQTRLLAQAATAIAISHEAGCINSDVKPQNMMISEDFSLLKLIDQGALLDLTQGMQNASFCTPSYAAPEIFEKISPAADVFSLGVSILEKLSKLPCATENFKKLTYLILLGFAQEQKGQITEKDYSSCYRGKISESIADLLPRYNALGNEKISAFIGLLLKDCFAIEPKDRISAAQVAEILHVFSSYLEETKINPNIECPKYSEVKTMAIQDCPKSIPIALRKMLFDTNPKIQQKAALIIKNLVKSDPSYKGTPSYGLTLLVLRKQNKLLKFLNPMSKNLGEQSFESWAKENPQALQQLKQRVYVSDQIPGNEQDMPVSKEIYDTLQKCL